MLARLTGRADVVFGVTVAGRPAEIAGVERMVGMFINTLPLRMQVQPRDHIGVLLRSLQERQSRLIGAQFVGLAAVQQRVGIGPLFDTLLVFENYPIPRAGGERRTTGLHVQTAGAHDETHYPLSLAIAPGLRLQLRVEYRPDVFAQAEVETIVDRLVRVFESLSRDAARYVADVNVLAPSERTGILAMSRGKTLDTAHMAGTAHTADTPASVLELFQTQAAATPDRVAIVNEGDHVTYAALRARADDVMWRLRVDGVEPEQIVAVVMPRSVDLISAVLGTLQAGAVCMPIDSAYPEARTRAMVDDAAPVRIVDAAYLAGVPSRAPGALSASASASGAITPGRVRDVRAVRAIRADQAAYIIYTSGATGRPKGIAVSHGALANKIATFAAHVGVTGATRYAFTCAVGFDPAFEQMFCALAGGGTVVVVPDHVRDDAVRFADYAMRTGLTVLDVTPGLARQLLLDDAWAALPEVLIVGSDTLPVALANELRAQPSAGRVLNVYGPTETCIDATAFEIAAPIDGDSVPIGAPLQNYSTYVLDDGLSFVPAGVPGELYIAGAGVARGYLNRTALAAERFVADPYGPPGTRMYRSGDLARWRADGGLEFLGRDDQQVKIRGVRIELGEVEAALRMCAGVAQAVAVVHDDASGEKRLAGYLAPPPGTTIDVDEVRRAMEEHWPPQFVPAVIVVLEEVPLTSHGKVDRRALPQPELTIEVSHPPRTPEEDVLCELFGDVLGAERVGTSDSFLISADTRCWRCVW